MCVYKNHAFIFRGRPPKWSGTRSPQYAQAYIGLSPVSDNSVFRLQGSHSEIISNIGLTSLASSIFEKFVGISVHIPSYTLAKKDRLFLVVRMVPVYYYEYWILDKSVIE